MSTSVAEHLERHLGPMEGGWTSAQGPAGVQVCLFRNQPLPNTLTYATLGLSHHTLALKQQRTVRQELVLAVDARFEHGSLPLLLLHVADDILGRHRAPLRGEVLPLGHPILPQTTAQSLYATLPVAFPDTFASFSGSTPPTVFVWLVPILPAEESFLRAHGWRDFEALLEDSEADLYNLARPSTV